MPSTIIYLIRTKFLPLCNVRQYYYLLQNNVQQYYYQVLFCIFARLLSGIILHICNIIILIYNNHANIWQFAALMIYRSSSLHLKLKLQINFNCAWELFDEHSRAFLIKLQNALFYFNTLLAEVRKLLYKSNDTTSPKTTVKK